MTLLGTQDKEREIRFFNKFWRDGKNGILDIYEEDKYQETFRSLKLNGSNDLLLDAGCGSGAWGIRLARKGYIVIGIDISRKLIKSTKKWSGQQFSAVLGDLEHLPFRPEIFDVCFCGGILHHFRKPHFAISELYRALKSGGKLCLVEPNGSNPSSILGRLVMRTLPQKWVMKKGIATPNERLHNVKSYIKILADNNFLIKKVIFTYKDDFPNSPLKGTIELLIFTRAAFFKLIKWIFPPLIAATELTMMATKRGL